MNGRWFVAADGRLPYGKPWLRLAGLASIAKRWKILVVRRLIQNGSREARLRRDLVESRCATTARACGPDPLRPGFEVASGADVFGIACGASGPAARSATRSLDQEIIAGIGNAIRVEGLFQARVSPWRKVEDLEAPSSSWSCPRTSAS